MSSSIKLNFINKSNDVNNSDVLIFQQNEATSFDEVAVAWKVIQYCGQGDNHPFDFPLSVTIGYRDSWGNYTQQLPAPEGEAFKAVLATSGDQLVAAGSANSASEIELLNALPNGTIDALVYRGGSLVAQKTNVAPQQKAVFEFKPTIWIGVVAEVDQGQVIDAAILQSVNTQISLLGIASADIVMTGGGAGPDAQPFQFTLQNIVMA